MQSLTAQEVKVKYDYVVLGAGAGGLKAAIELKNKGHNVLLIGENIGGECTNYGCVPSKSLIEIADRYFKYSREQKRQLYPHILEFVKTQIEQVSNKNFRALFDNQIEFIQGFGIFKSTDSLTVHLLNNEKIEVKFRNCIVATGSSPRTVQISGLDNSQIITNQTLLNLDSIPESLTIVGGGHTAAEYATAFAKLGCKVQLLARSKLLADEPDEIAEILRSSLVSLGVKIYEDVKNINFDNQTNELIIENSKFEKNYLNHSEIYLQAIGRIANTKNLNLKAAGVKVDNNELIIIDKDFKTSNNRIRAIGDCANQINFTHLAEKQAEFIALQTVNPFAKFAPRVVPAVIFTDPIISSVGDLQESTFVKKFKINFSKSDKAIITKNEDIGGLIFVNMSNRQIKGVSLYGKPAEELINFFTLAIQNNMTVEKLKQTIIPYPTYLNQLSDFYQNFEADYDLLKLKYTILNFNQKLFYTITKVFIMLIVIQIFFMYILSNNAY